MKYIDADKLIAKIRAEIEKKINSISGCPFIQADFGIEKIQEGKLKAYKEILAFLDTLPVEEPKGLHFTPINRLIQTLAWNKRNNTYAKKLVDCLVREGYTEDASVLQGYISYMNGYNIPMATMDEREQPEVEQDIANVVKSYFDVQELENVKITTTGVGLLNFAEHIKKIILNSAFILYNHITENSGNKTLDDEIDAIIKMNDLWGGLLPNTLIKYTSRHFYELGQSYRYQIDREEFAKLKAKEWQDGYNEG